MKKIRSTGFHIAGTLIDCDDGIINDYNSIHGFLDNFPTKIGMRKIPFPDNPFLKSCDNDDDPLNYGYSGFVLLTSSHFSIHCWPAYDNAVDFDVFSCYPFDVEKTLYMIQDFFGGNHLNNVLVERGPSGAKIL